MKRAITLATMSLTSLVLAASVAAPAQATPKTIQGKKIMQITAITQKMKKPKTIPIQGQPGIQGEQGMKGDPGIKGDKGDPGAAGQPGAQGTPGVQGIPGAQGIQGEPGSNGRDGTGFTTGITFLVNGNCPDGTTMQGSPNRWTVYANDTTGRPWTTTGSSAQLFLTACTVN